MRRYDMDTSARMGALDDLMSAMDAAEAKRLKRRKKVKKPKMGNPHTKAKDTKSGY